MFIYYFYYLQLSTYWQICKNRINAKEMLNEVPLLLELLTIAVAKQEIILKFSFDQQSPPGGWFPADGWLVVVCCWLVVVGYLLLMGGCWLFAADGRLLVICCWWVVAGGWGGVMGACRHRLYQILIEKSCQVAFPLFAAYLWRDHIIRFSLPLTGVVCPLLVLAIELNINLKF